MNTEVSVYVVTHKKVKLDELELDSCYKTIRVGNYAKEHDENTYSDNIGENISQKNPNFCELTAHYWIWKNDDSNIVGLCHYRRFLSRSVLSNKNSFILNKTAILESLNSYDILLPYRPIARRTVKQIYLDFGFDKDLDILREVINEKYPEYLCDYDELMLRHSNYPANMLICKKELFDKYSSWLFDILFEVEKRTDLSNYTQQQARIYGYMSERLLEVWVKHNRLRIKHFKMLKVDESFNLRAKIIDIISVCLNR